MYDGKEASSLQAKHRDFASIRSVVDNLKMFFRELKDTGDKLPRRAVYTRSDFGDAQSFKPLSISFTPEIGLEDGETYLPFPSTRDPGSISFEDLHDR